MKIAPKTRAAVLSEALPHLQRFAGHVIVVKYGGNALAVSTEDAMEVFARDIALLHAVGMKPVVVHGTTVCELPTPKRWKSSAWCCWAR